jgi:hypothetical protein
MERRAHVEALVKHLTSEAAAKRHYGAEWDKRRCSGIVKKVESVIVNARSKVGQTIITATYVLPDGRIKDVALNKHSVILVSHLPSEQNNEATTPNAVSTNTPFNRVLNQMPTATSPWPRLIQMPSALRESSIRTAGTAATSTLLLSSNSNGNTTNTTLANTHKNPMQNQMPTAPSNSPESSITAIIHQAATTTIVDPITTATNIGPVATSASHQSFGSVINAINIVALGNPNIVQVAHGFIWENLMHKMLLLHQIFLQFSGTGLITLGKSFIRAREIY